MREKRQSSYGRTIHCCSTCPEHQFLDELHCRIGQTSVFTWPDYYQASIKGSCFEDVQNQDDLDDQTANCAGRNLPGGVDERRCIHILRVHALDACPHIREVAVCLTSSVAGKTTYPQDGGGPYLLAKRI